MKHLTFILTTLILFSCAAKQSEEVKSPKWSIIIHGGAGNFYNGDIDPELKAAYFSSLEEAISIGSDILEAGGTSVEAVEKTINFLENDSLFNAGKGAVLTSIGTAELDASIMHGDDLNSGAVAGMRHSKNPISAARAVMEKSFHVMMAGDGADRFAAKNGVEQVENDYFMTARRKRSFEREKEKRAVAEKMGTVGCVAKDEFGSIVAGTSTGGTSFKQWGRVGDAPIIGAGTYANSKSCGISATGTGEFFIRGTVARDIAALMEMKDMNSQDAADQLMHEKLVAMDAERAKGGVIGVDHNGQFITL